MHWDDLRVVRAVYQAGSYAAAARLLGVNETTVPRRLARLEKDLAVTLFEAADGQRRPTAACEKVIELSEAIARQAEKISGVVGDRGVAVERRRLAATDSVSTYLLAPRLAEFLAAHPTIAIELVVSTANVDFSRWEADIAIRLKRPEKGEFIMTKLMDFDLFLFEPAAAHDRAEEIVCAYPDDLDGTPESRFLSRTGMARRARCISKNVLITKQLVASGKAAGILPGYMCADLVADDRFRIVRLPQQRSAWLLIQRHLKDDRPTRTVVDWIRSCADTVRLADVGGEHENSRE